MINISIIRHVLVFVAIGVGTSIVFCAETDPAKAEEDRVWAEEELKINKCCDEEPSGLEKSFTGIVTLDKVEYSKAESQSPEKITIGTVHSDANNYQLRVNSAHLLDVLKNVPPGRKIFLTGHLRVNGKYFYVSDISLTLPGEGIAPPASRKKRGGM